MSIYTKALKAIKSNRSISKELAKSIDKKIPASAPYKIDLIAIVLASDISSADEAIKSLNGKINYLESFYGNSPDESAIGGNPLDVMSHESMIDKYRLMVKTLQHYLPNC